jgi:hypothetical protein
MPYPRPDDVDFREEADSPIYADDRNFYKVEKWTRDCLMALSNKVLPAIR